MKQVEQHRVADRIVRQAGPVRHEVAEEDPHVGQASLLGLALRRLNHCRLDVEGKHHAAGARRYSHGESAVAAPELDHVGIRPVEAKPRENAVGVEKRRPDLLLGHSTLSSFQFAALRSAEKWDLLPVAGHHPLAQHFVGSLNGVGINHKLLLAGVLGNEFQAELEVLEAGAA